MQLELIAAERGMDLGFQPALRVDLASAAAAVNLETATAGRFDVVECDVGVLQQLVGGAAVRRGAHDAEAGADGDRMAQNVVGLGDRREHALGQAFALLGAHGARLDDGELVAAETREEIGLANAGAQALRDRLQQGIADRMAVGIVDLFELVEVDPVQRQRAALAEALERLLERLAEVEAVGDAGERIVVRQPLDLLLRCAASQ